MSDAAARRADRPLTAGEQTLLATAAMLLRVMASKLDAARDADSAGTAAAVLGMVGGSLPDFGRLAALIRSPR